MDPTRRKLLAGAGAAAAGAAILGLSSSLLTPVSAEEVLGNSSSGSSTSPSAGTPPSAKKYVFVIDLDACNGCQKCTEGCQTEMQVPPTWGGEVGYAGRQSWIQVFDLGNGTFMPVPCQNCQDAPCAKVCPVGATFYSEDSIVMIDQDRCIGCRYCIVACPYERRFFNWADPPLYPEDANVTYSTTTNIPHRKGVAEKCIWCAHRVTKGDVPACVESCTTAGMSALWFGDSAQDVVSNGKEVMPLSTLINKRGAYRLKEELGTLPQAIYLPPRGETG